MPDFGRWTSNGGDPSLNEINRTDRFLDALAFEQPVYSTDPGEAELAQLMAGWRDDVRDAPLTAALTPRDAVVALDHATASRRRTRTSLALVGSVAAAVLCLGGFGAVVAGAGPGDALYGLRTMLFGDSQQVPRDDAVVLAAQTQMAEVQQLIDQGQWDAAQDKLQTLTTTVATVNDVERKQELVNQWQELTVKVDAQDAAATVPPGVPPPVFPDVPVVVLDTPPRRKPRPRRRRNPRRRCRRRPPRRRRRLPPRHRRRPPHRRRRVDADTDTVAVDSVANAAAASQTPLADTYRRRRCRRRQLVDATADAVSGDAAADTDRW